MIRLEGKIHFTSIKADADLCEQTPAIHPSVLRDSNPRSNIRLVLVVGRNFDIIGVWGFGFLPSKRRAVLNSG
jgi:hypothetical protein